MRLGYGANAFLQFEVLDTRLPLDDVVENVAEDVEVLAESFLNFPGQSHKL
jgi:hypothetical protein